jgi:hypothetical protein
MQVPVQPIDVVGLVGAFMGTLIVLVPVVGLTARFALKPIAEAMAKVRESQGSQKEIALMQQRIDLLEQQLSAVESDLYRIKEVQEFQAQLRAPKPEN